jgi:Rrf2 family protein
MLSTTSQYALRAVAHLAAQPRGKMISGHELSRRTGIPRNYLSKILLPLGSAGIVEAVRGNSGGYRLAAAPETTPIIRVIELFERNMTRRACLLGLRPVCSDSNPCPAHRAWKPAKEAYFHLMETATLQDIALARPEAGAGGRRRTHRNDQS